MLSGYSTLILSLIGCTFLVDLDSYDRVFRTILIYSTHIIRSMKRESLMFKFLNLC